MQRLINTALISAQRTAALQYQGDAATILRPLDRSVAMTGWMGRMYRFGVHGRIIADFVTFWSYEL
jgi:hypothetical protein